MKKEIHPQNLRLICFKDISNGNTLLVQSTMPTDKIITLEGVEYPLVEVEISSTSHPFYTGDTRLMDTAGRAERFKNRAAKAK